MSRPTYEELTNQILHLRTEIAELYRTGNDEKAEELEMELLVAEEYMDKTISKGRR